MRRARRRMVVRTLPWAGGRDVVAAVLHPATKGGPRRCPPVRHGPRTSTPSSSARGSRASTCSTGSATRWACRRGCSRRAAASAGPGTGTGTRAPAATPTATSTASSFDERPAAGVGVERALSRAARDPRLPRARRRALRPAPSDITFDTRVTAATFDEDTDAWTVTTDTGETRHGALRDHRASARCRRANTPSFAGVDSFGGDELPHRPVAAREASTSPASGSASSAPARARCRRSR